MTTEEKANELVGKFIQAAWDSGNHIGKPLVLSCVIVCVEEIIEALPEYCPAGSENDKNVSYWNEVLTHLKQ